MRCTNFRQKEAGRGEFTIMIKIRLGRQEQLLKSPRQDDRVNGRASEEVEVLAKNPTFW